jgi:hypothetical protein
MSTQAKPYGKCEVGLAVWTNVGPWGSRDARRRSRLYDLRAGADTNANERQVSPTSSRNIGNKGVQVSVLTKRGPDAA